MIAGIIAVESRREHIEKYILPELETYCREVKVFYDPTYGTTKRGDHDTVFKNAYANQARAYRETFASRQDNEPVILTTDDFIFGKDWKAIMDRVMAETKGCPVYCLYSSRKVESNERGYVIKNDKVSYYDVCSIIDIPINLYDEFEAWVEQNPHLFDETNKRSGLRHHDIRFNRFLYEYGCDICVLAPSLVKHASFKSEMGHGQPFANHNFIDDIKES